MGSDFFILLFNIINISESSPIMSNEVGEHMARNLRPFLYTESLQILQIQSSTLVDSPLQLIPQVFYGV
jgi:hypothetical protein